MRILVVCVELLLPIDMQSANFFCTSVQSRDSPKTIRIFSSILPIYIQSANFFLHQRVEVRLKTITNTFYYVRSSVGLRVLIGQPSLNCFSVNLAQLRYFLGSATNSGVGFFRVVNKKLYSQRMYTIFLVRLFPPKINLWSKQFQSRSFAKFREFKFRES